MRISALLLTLTSLTALCSGCCGPWGYGPCGPYAPYAGCVDNGPWGNHRQRHLERRQAREMRQWYRNLNSPGYMPGGFPAGGCPCGGNGFPGGMVMDNGMMMDGMVMDDGMSNGMVIDDGMMMDGQFIDGQMMSGGTCPHCQQQMPQEMSIEPQPAVPEQPELKAAPGDQPSAYIAPPTQSMSPEVQPTPVSSSPPVRQMMYVPQSFQ